MQGPAKSVWVFINLICFGMCVYLYLIWSQHWMYKEFEDDTGKDPHKSNLFLNNINYSFVRKRSAVGSYWSRKKGTETPGKYLNPSVKNVVRNIQGGPRFPNIHDAILELDSNKYFCDDYTKTACINLTSKFKELLLKEFQRLLKVNKPDSKTKNVFNKDRKKEMSNEEIMCALKQVKVETVTAEDEPFAHLGFDIRPRHYALQEGTNFEACAVVTSAGALLGSNLGELIDSHDMVLRFNNAPTENYTADVGDKTNFRILNSQVVAKPEFNFLHNPIYKDLSILIWDPGNFTSNLEKWYNQPDFPFFPFYKKLLENRRGADVHLLKPKVLWDLWSVLQNSTAFKLQQNPPSSGFLGMWFSLHRCDLVRVFEYVPSVRASRRCHYYSPVEDPACTLSGWHPMAAEKALAERLRRNNDIEVFQGGYIQIPGFSRITCEN